MPQDSDKCDMSFILMLCYITDSSTISSLMLGILLNSVGSLAKIFSLIVVLNADKTSSPDLDTNISKLSMSNFSSWRLTQNSLPGHFVALRKTPLQ